jgi:hypothetical protein
MRDARVTFIGDSSFGRGLKRRKEMAIGMLTELSDPSAMYALLPDLASLR